MSLKPEIIRTWLPASEKIVNGEWIEEDGQAWVRLPYAPAILIEGIWSE